MTTISMRMRAKLPYKSLKRMEECDGEKNTKICGNVYGCSVMLMQFPGFFGKRGRLGPGKWKKYPVITTNKLENAIIGETKNIVLNATPMYGGEITWSIAESYDDVEASIKGNVLSYKPLKNENTGFRSCKQKRGIK